MSNSVKCSSVDIKEYAYDKLISVLIDKSPATLLKIQLRYPRVLLCTVHPCSLAGVSKTYEAIDSEEIYLKQINYLCPVPATLQLTVGAQVMLAKNVDVTQGLVNGARGVVVGFEKGGEGRLRLLSFEK